MERLPLPARVVRPLGYPDVSPLPRERQEGLRAFWLDGLFSAFAAGFADPYYSLYMLSLGASNAQIGLVNTLAQLTSAAMAMPGATVADRTGRYKQLVIFSGLVSRAMWLVMLVTPWLLFNQQAVWVVLAAWVAIVGMGSLGSAAWTALSADLVPARLRGGYFASRNIVSQLVSLVAIPLAGQLVNAAGEPAGYQINFALAFLISGVSLYFYSRQPEHVAGHQADTLNTRQVLRRMLGLTTFMRFMTAHAILQLGVMMCGPFLNIYMAEHAGFSVGTIGLVTTVGALATLFGMRVLGRLHDRFGITWTMRLGIGVPLIPVAWLWVHAPWQGYLVNGLAALTWAGYNLGAFNLLLAATPDDHRPRYVAIYTTIISVVSALGPVVAGWMLDAVGFTTVFWLSGIIRGLGLLLFFILVREPELPPEPAAA